MAPARGAARPLRGTHASARGKTSPVTFPTRSRQTTEAPQRRLRLLGGAPPTGGESSRKGTEPKGMGSDSPGPSTKRGTVREEAVTPRSQRAGSESTLVRAEKRLAALLAARAERADVAAHVQPAVLGPLSARDHGERRAPHVHGALLREGVQFCLDELRVRTIVQRVTVRVLGGPSPGQAGDVPAEG
eukprot:1643491-Pyramimonas_sp.AAC.1